MVEFFAQISQGFETTTTSSDLTAADAGALAFMLVFYLILGAFALAGIIGMWKTFTKAGKPGWASIVPVYNGMVVAEIAGKPSWWGLGFLVSPISIVVAIICGMAIAKRFGRSDVFGIVALGLFSFVGYLMIGFGKDTYDSTATPTVQ